MIEVYIEQPSYAPRDENAALQWAIETFRQNTRSLKNGGTAKEWLAHNKTLLLHLKKNGRNYPTRWCTGHSGPRIF